MRKLTGAAAISALLLLMTPASQAQQGIAWRHDLQSAMQEAAATGRLVLVHFWSPTCGPCLKLDRNVFQDPQVAAQVTSRYVPVKVNTDESPAMAQQFGINYIPHDVVLSPRGEILQKLTSPAESQAYVQHMAHIASLHSQPRAVPNGGQQIAGPPQFPQGVPNQAYANLRLPAQRQLPAQQPPQQIIQQQPPTHAIVAQHPHPNVGGMMPPATATRGPLPGPTLPPNVQPPQINGMASAAAVPPAGNAGWIGNQPAPAAPRIAAQPTPPPAPSNVVQGMGQVPQPRLPGPVTPPAPAYGVGNPNIAPTVPNAGNAIAQRPSPQASWPPQLQPGVPPVGLDGYCPVALKHQRAWARGDQRWGWIHRGRTYLFSSPQARDEFGRNPDGYSPVLSGIDPVIALTQGQGVAGRREHGAEYRGLVFLFSTEQTLRQFESNPEGFYQQVRSFMASVGHGAARR